jgi:hypothetical protein
VFGLFDTAEPRKVQDEVAALYRGLFPGGHPAFVPRAFEWVALCFQGRHPDYQAIDLEYHDLEHTLQGTLCLMRLLQGRHRAGVLPAVPQSMFELALLAILFHDTGYLKRRDDLQGTGAKYTATHVGRSAAFAREFLERRGYARTDTAAIENMIRCTGVNVDLSAVPFQSEVERLLGRALGTADLLGQMAAPDYVDRLDALHREFMEAAEAGGEMADRFARYKSADDVRRMTPDFWKGYVVPRINMEFGGLYRFLNDPYPDGPNAYIQRIEENIGRLRQESRSDRGSPASRLRRRSDDSP